MHNYLKNRGIILLTILLVTNACQDNNAKSERIMELPDIYAQTIVNLIDFFNENGFDSNKRVYYSEIDNEGKITSKKIYTVSLSRLIYGLSYTSKYFPENNEKAENLVNFLLNNLIGTDSIGEYFVSFVEGDTFDPSPNLDV